MEKLPKELITSNNGFYAQLNQISGWYSIHRTDRSCLGRVFDNKEGIVFIMEPAPLKLKPEELLNLYSLARECQVQFGQDIPPVKASFSLLSETERKEIEDRDTALNLVRSRINGARYITEIKAMKDCRFIVVECKSPAKEYVTAMIKGMGLHIDSIHFGRNANYHRFLIKY